MGEDVRDAAPTQLSQTTHGTPSRDRIHSHFSPYQRVSPPWTVYEVIKTAVLCVVALPIRLIYMLLAGALMLLIASIAMAGRPRIDTQKTAEADATDPADDDSDPLLMPLAAWRKALLATMFPIVRSILFVSFGVYHIRTDKREFSDEVPQKRLSTGKAYVIVANHLGYIDILVLLCMFRGSFVAKGELESAPIVGPLARALQCMFVRKGHPLTSQLIQRVQSTYQCHWRRENCPGCPACMSKLVIFPEGTTTNGTAMVPFRTGVFNAGLPVKPVCIRFPYRRFNMSWETIRFREHLFRAMTQAKNNVYLSELPVYEPSAEEMADVRLYASNVQMEIARVLEQPIVPLNRKHKFLYHSWLLGKEVSNAKVLEKAEALLSADEQLVYFNANKTLNASV